MIQISNLKKTFGDKVATNIESFRINPGDMLGLVGNNGAGKSTLFRLILDLIAPDKDADGVSILNDGVNVHDSEQWKDWTGAFLDESFLIDYLTPDEYLDFIARVSGCSKDEQRALTDKFQHFLENEILGEKKLIRNLSAGQKQKLGILAAMIGSPKVLVLDEPFNFLDPTSQNALKTLLSDYNRETGATILISSHNLQHTVDICPRIALMEHGVIIRDIIDSNDAVMQELEEYFK